ncbi:MAG: P-type conjugative transfer protein TrbJ [Pseudomonadota bacterium]
MRSGMISLAVFAAIGAPVPASAQLFGGGIVYDPANHAENILTAAQTLETVNNQIEQLRNEAEMLVADAKNLTSLDFDVSPELRAILDEIDGLLKQAKAISYQIEHADEIFRTQYPEDYAGWSNTELADIAKAHWRTSRAALHDTILMQSKIVEAVETDSDLIDALVAGSQSAAGNLDVAQAGNQIMALSAKQLMQLQEMLAAHYRAEALERARAVQEEEAADERHKRFVGERSAYGGG